MKKPLPLATPRNVSLAGFCALALSLCFVLPSTAQLRFTAQLSGGQEVPSTVSAANGVVTVVLDGNDITVEGSFEGLMADFTAAHIHTALAGTNGSVAVPLEREGENMRGGALSIAAGTQTLTSEQLEALMGRRMYINVHSQLYPGGEIRGQLVPEGAVQLHAVLSGTQEVPANVSSAVGAVMLELNDDDSLFVTGSFRGLSSAYTMSHLHTGLAGEVGPPAVTLSATPATDGLTGEIQFSGANRFLLTDTQADLLMERRMYANVHSVNFGPGEIRGQVRAADTVPFTAVLSSMGEQPVNNSAATGALLAEITPDDMLIVSGSFVGLRGDYTASHIHLGLAGESGGVVKGLTAPTQTDAETKAYAYEMQAYDLSTFTDMTADQAIAALQQRTFYPNIHSTFRGGGEIRGQLAPSSSVQLRANLSGRAEVTPNVSGGHGSTLVEFTRDGSKLVVSGAFRGLSSDLHTVAGSPAHIHAGGLGVNGGISQALAVEAQTDARGGAFHAEDNTYTLSGPLAADIVRLLERDLYVNVHTASHTGGELRGQIVGAADYVYEANLSGVNEAPPVLSLATGAAIGHLHDDTLAVTGSFMNLKAVLPASAGGRAHIHTAAVGAPGSVTVPLTVSADENLLAGSFDAAENTTELTGDQMHDFLMGDQYVNVHSTAHTGGEIRGQLFASPNLAPGAATVESPADGTIIQLEEEGSSNVEWSTATDPNGNTVHYVWQGALDEAFTLIASQIYAGTTTMLTIPHANIIAALTAAGLDPSDMTTVHHRIVTTDGSMLTAGAGVSAMVGTGTSTETAEIPKAFALRGSYPNPARVNAAIRFDLPGAARVSVAVVDVLGRQVLALPGQEVQAGFNRTIDLKAGTLPSGVYFYRVTAETANGTKVQTGRLVLVR